MLASLDTQRNIIERRSWRFRSYFRSGRILGDRIVRGPTKNSYVFEVKKRWRGTHARELGSVTTADCILADECRSAHHKPTRLIKKGLEPPRDKKVGGESNSFTSRGGV